MATSDHPAGMTCLCFSKDRPFQLDGYLRSVRRFFPVPVAMTVLYKSTDAAIQEGYACVKRDHPDVPFVQETDFGREVLDWVNGIKTPLVFFGCDDVVFRRPVDAASIEALLNGQPAVLGFSMRLGLNIRHTHTREEPVPHPDFLSEQPVLRWSWRGQPADWGYPFEVNGTVYRAGFVRALFQSLENIRRAVAQAEWRHPNYLEYAANQILTHSPQMPGELASFTESCLVVPSVNQVQNIAWNHLLGEIRTVRELETLRRDGKQMDLNAYASAAFDRIHVGEFFVEEKECHATTA